MTVKIPAKILTKLLRNRHAQSNGIKSSTKKCCICSETFPSATLRCVHAERPQEFESDTRQAPISNASLRIFTAHAEWQSRCFHQHAPEKSKPPNRFGEVINGGLRYAAQTIDFSEFAGQKESRIRANKCIYLREIVERLSRELSTYMTKELASPASGALSGNRSP